MIEAFKRRKEEGYESSTRSKGGSVVNFPIPEDRVWRTKEVIIKSPDGTAVLNMKAPDDVRTREVEKYERERNRFHWFYSKPVTGYLTAWIFSAFQQSGVVVPRVVSHELPPVPPSVFVASPVKEEGLMHYAQMVVKAGAWVVSDFPLMVYNNLPTIGAFGISLVSALGINYLFRLWIGAPKPIKCHFPKQAER